MCEELKKSWQIRNFVADEFTPEDATECYELHYVQWQVLRVYIQIPGGPSSEAVNHNFLNNFQSILDQSQIFLIGSCGL